MVSGQSREAMGGRHRGAGVSAWAEFKRRRRQRRGIRAASVVLGLALCAGAVRLLAHPRSAAGSPREAALAGAAGALLVAMAMGRWWGGRDVARWARGAAGERRTADLLAALPGRRWTVWHDLPVGPGRANIDHVAVGPTGLWVVDSKTTRTAVSARGWRVRFGDRRLDPSPLLWEAATLGRELAAAGWRPAVRRGVVRPVVAVHGGGLRRRGGRAGTVRVVPAQELVDRISRGRRRLGRADRRAAAALLEARYGPAAGGTGPRPSTRPAAGG